MTLCVVVNETKNCFVSTCTCPNSRTRRGVNSHLLTPNPSSGPQEATCKFEVILSENISDNCQGKMTNLRDERTENPMEYTTLKCETRKNTMKNKGEENKLPTLGKILSFNFFIFKMMDKILKKENER